MGTSLKRHLYFKSSGSNSLGEYKSKGENNKNNRMKNLTIHFECFNIPLQHIDDIINDIQQSLDKT